MKRIVIFLILLSMVLHCATRLGLMTWLYQNRQAIAYNLRLVNEPHITECSHDATLDRLVEINTDTDSSDELPAKMFQVREINLFCEFNLTNTYPQYAFLRETQLPNIVERNYPSPDLGIFHPPV
jgi:hypothetical protein